MTTYARKQFVGSLLEAGEDSRQVSLIADEVLGDQIIATFADGDTTPSVAVPNSLFKTSNSGATTITDLDDGFSGQIVTVLFGDANTTVDFTASGLVGNNGVDWTPANGDSMRCIYDGTDWNCVVSDPAGAGYLKNVVEDTTPQLGGDLDGNGNAINAVILKEYSLESTSPSSSSGAITFNYANGNAFQVTLTENITSITLSNWPTTGEYGEMVIKFVQNGTGSWTVSGWPAAVKWPGGTAPTITTTATTGTDIVVLKTWNAGSTVYGDYSQDYQ